MVISLSQTKIEGLHTNLSFLLDILHLNEFQDGHVSTSFISLNEEKLNIVKRKVA
jgi:pyruvate carboxylase